MPIERLSIRKMRVLGAFPAVLDDLNFKFSRGSKPPDPPCMFMLYRSVHSKQGCKQDYRQITSPFIRIYNLTILMRKQKLSKDVEMMSENWEVRLDLIWQKTSWLNPCKSAANLFIGPTLPTAAACCRLLPRAMLRFWGAQEAFFKKGSCVHLPCILWSGRAEPY